MSNSKFDTRQVTSKESLDQLSSGLIQLDELLGSINSNDTPPLKLSVTGLNKVISIGGIVVQNPETSQLRTIPPISNTLPVFTSGTITVGATGVGNIVFTPAVSSPISIGMAANQYRKFGVYLDDSGNLSLTAGLAGVSLAAAGTPSSINGAFGIGYFVVRTDGSNNVQNILVTDIYQYAGSGGGGAGGTIDRVTQNAHGFSVGDVLYLNGSTYEKAYSDLSSAAEVVGVVSRVADVNTFELTLSGEVSGLTSSNFVENSVPAMGSTVFLGLNTIINPAPVVHVGTSGVPYGTDVTTTLRRGQTFTTPSTVSAIASIDIEMAKGVSVETNNVVVDLWATSSGLPSVLLASSTPKPKNTISVSFALNNFVFPSTVILSPSTVYAFTVRVDGVFSSSLSMNTRSVSDYAYGNYIDSGNAGVTWGAVTDWDLQKWTINYQALNFKGKMTTIEPSVIGQVSLPIGVMSGANSIYVAPKRGSVIGGANNRTQISLPNNTSTFIQNVSTYEAGELVGWISIGNTHKFYVSAPFAKNGAATDWNISPSYMGDVPPAGFSMSISSGGLISVTLPNIGGFTSAYINFALNAPAVGTTFPLNVNITSITHNYRATSGNDLVYVNDYFISSSGTSSTLTLPTAVGAAGKIYIIKSRLNVGELLNVSTINSETMDGSTSIALARFDSIQLMSNGTNWEIF